MTNLLKDVLDERAERAGTPVVDIDAITAAGERRARRGTALRAGAAGGAALLAAATVTAFVLVDLPGGGSDDGTPDTAQAPDLGWSPHDLTYAKGTVFHVPTADVEVDAGAKVSSYVTTDDGFVWAAEDGTVSFTPAAGGATVEIGTVSTDGRYLASDDTGSLAAWISPGDDPTLTVYDTAAGRVVASTDQDTGPGMDYYRDGRDVVGVVGIDDGAVTWFNRAGIVRTEVLGGRTTVLGPTGEAMSVDDVGGGLITSDAGDQTTGTSLTRVGPSLTQGVEVPHTGNAQISPDGGYVSFEDADELVVTDLTTGKDVQPANPGYDYWVVSQWVDEDTIGGFGVRDIASLDNPEGTDSGPVELFECEVPKGACTVVDETTIDFEAFAFPIGQSFS